MHPLKKSTSKSMTKWWKINENLRGWVPLEPCWLKITPSWSDLGARWPRGSIFHWFLVHFGIPKSHKNRWKNEVIFRRPKKLCFLRKKVPKAPKWRSKSHRKSSFFWHLTKLQNRAPACTRSQFSRFEGLPNPSFFRDHFRKPSSCCTGAVVSQIIVENDAPESVQNG